MPGSQGMGQLDKEAQGSPDVNGCCERGELDAPKDGNKVGLTRSSVEVDMRPSQRSGDIMMLTNASVSRLMGW